MKNIIANIISKLHLPKLSSERGVVLPIILMAIGGLSLVGAAAVSISTGEMNIAHNDRNYKTAINMAEAGINDVVDGIQGNRALIPMPIGAIQTASYTFNTALDNTGRYIVTVELPVVTQVNGISLINASTVTVADPSRLAVGDSITIGNANVHISTRIGAITGNTLILTDSKNNPYYLPQQVDNTMWVAKNLLRVTSQGQAGINLPGIYNSTTLTNWRNASGADINANPNPVPQIISGSFIRSSVTLQAEYDMKEIQLFSSYSADVNQKGNTFDGPILIANYTDPKTGQVTTGNMDVAYYSQGDYSGPIFNATGQTAATAVQFYSGKLGSGLLSYPVSPKVINIPANKLNLATPLTNAQTNAACYQASCAVAGNHQIYYVNGYQLDVKAYSPGTDGTGLPMRISDDVTVTTTRLTFSFEILQTFENGAADNVNVSLSTNPNPGTLNGTTIPIASMTVTYAPLDPASAAGTITLNGNNIVFQNKKWYTQGTTVYVDVNITDIPVGGTYLRLYDGSNNMPGFTNAKIWSNGIWVTKMGNIQSQEWEGDLTYYSDTGPGGHGANHALIKTTTPGVQARGYYLPNNSNIVKNPPDFNGATGRAVLFGGKTIKTATMPDGTVSNWVVGDKAEFFTTYYIHTNAVGSCNDHDIMIVSRTIVTYLGDSQKCNSTEIKRLFLVETIWNHLKTNDFNRGVQPDDTDPNITGIPHKGYYKWVKSADKNDNDNKPLTPDQMLGDKEFNSVFNHSAQDTFRSAVINTNISRIRMIGAANPPVKWDNASSSMYVRPDTLSIKGIVAGAVVIASNFTLPANPQNWDWVDMVGNKSAFIMPYMISGTSYNATRDFDFADMSIASGSITPYTINGLPTLPDMTMSMPIAAVSPTATTIPLYKANTNPYDVWSWNVYNNPPTGIWTAGTNWGTNGTDNTPNAALYPAGTPIMDPNALPTTKITATISGPYFTTFEIKRGYANLLFDAANGIPFNIQNLKIETKGAGANITIGTAANPATLVVQNTFKLESEDCGGQINFDFTGKMMAKKVEMENNVTYDIKSNAGSPNASCLSPTMTYIYLKKNRWQELRN